MRLFITLLPILFIIGVCTASEQPKGKKNSNEKEVKEKRDAPVSPPYSYNVPQKAFHTPQHPQPKYTNVEHQQGVQKVVPLENVQAKHEISVAPIQHGQEQAQQYHPTTFHQYTQEQPSVAQSYKGFEDFGFPYPNYEGFSQMPIVHYNGDFNKLTSSIISVPSYSIKSSPIYSSYKASPSYSYSHAPYVSHSLPKYSQAHYPASYTSSGPYSYSQSSLGHSSHLPTTIYVHQSVPQKITKLPEYATGLKGLGHYSSQLSVAPIAVHPSNSYIKHNYEAPIYTQTERPFKASAYLGATQVNSVPVEYAVPSKGYLPAKETYSHPPQVEYQIQYIQQQQPTKVPAITNSYLPSKVIAHEVPNNIYITSTTAHPIIPAKHYLPAVEKPVNSYLPAIEKPANNYLPAIEKPVSTYLPPKNSYPSASFQNHQYATSPSPVEHHQYQPQESYDSAEYLQGHHQ